MSALLLSKQFADIDTDLNSNEVKALNTHFENALTSTLSSLDIDSLSEPIPLELLADLGNQGPWQYVYKYPTRCAKFRRIQSGAVIDTSSTSIDKRVALYQGQKAIYTNEYAAVAECIVKDVSLAALSPSAGMAVAYKLAFLASPLVVGKGAAKLRDEVYRTYLLMLAEAQELDANENFNFETPWTRSEFVRTRLS